ncbi:GAF domain-containing protein [Heliobacterium undosum]|uniref:histidine kinase n=1 Tax=Heliomicrobium undosum TaxID=121734 RepID=A0A845L1Q3_9FIRM|nr:ATP-binding protein [Heliomicrobium undosum]MZP30482.1 GAF domain-containing protein [Heliomicrobium undosum]
MQDDQFIIRCDQASNCCFHHPSPVAEEERQAVVPSGRAPKQVQKSCRKEDCLKVLVKLNQLWDADQQEIRTFVLDEAVRLTGSELGWLGFVHDDDSQIVIRSWSRHVPEKCALFGCGDTFSIQGGGFWAEAIRRRQPIIENRYRMDIGMAKGCPKDHVDIERILAVPIIQGDRVILLALLVNKATDYDETDIDQVCLLIDGMWKAIQRKGAQDALRLSEERFGKAFNLSPSIMSIKDLQCRRYVDVNESFVRVIGYRREEIIGRTAEELGIWADEAKLVDILLKNGATKSMEIIIRTRSGEERTGLMSMELMQLEGREYILTVTNDITEQRRLEKELQRLDRLNLVGQLASAFGHEIRNPLQTVRGFLQILQRKAQHRDDDEHFALMISELDRANQIITEYLTLSRKKADRFARNNLNEVVQKLAPLLEAQAFNVNKDIRFDLAPAPDVWMDEKQIRQLILNLLNNGLEAMAPRQLITIRTGVTGNRVILSVEDQGTGISPEILNKLGTPFVTSKSDGTGLGLAVCYGIVENHKAELDVQTGGGGTVFSVLFPALEA